jgi:hypothetical protein
MRSVKQLVMTSSVLVGVGAVVSEKTKAAGRKNRAMNKMCFMKKSPFYQDSP